MSSVILISFYLHEKFESVVGHSFSQGHTHTAEMVSVCGPLQVAVSFTCWQHGPVKVQSALEHTVDGSNLNLNGIWYNMLTICFAK